MTPSRTAPVSFPRPSRADARLSLVLDAFLAANSAVAREQDLPENICLHAAEVTKLVLPVLGIRGAVTVGVDVVVSEAAAIEHFACGGTVVGLAGRFPALEFFGDDRVAGDDWFGHVVTYIPAKQGRSRAKVVDPTAGQFARPWAGIGASAYHSDADPRFLRGTPMVVGKGGATYWLRRSPRLNGFRASSYLAEEPEFWQLYTAEVTRRAQALIAA